MRQNYWHPFFEGRFYHIYNRTNNKELLFLDNYDRNYFLKQWNIYLGPYLDIYAYCLMSNHFHFIVKIRETDEAFFKAVEQDKTVAADKFSHGEIDIDSFLEDQLKRFFASYAQTFNKKYKRHGSVFQKRFKRIELHTLSAILNRICYVHHNPLHHGSSHHYDGWHYSSYNAYISDKPTKICRTEGLLLFNNQASISFFQIYHNLFHEDWVLNQKWKDFEDSEDMLK
jgi:putative transposase